MTREQLAEVEAMYAVVLRRVRGIAGRFSRLAIARQQVVLREVLRSLQVSRYGRSSLTKVEAKQLRAIVSRNLQRMETGLTESVATAKLSILQAIADEHATVQVKASRVLGLPEGGVKLKLSVITSDTTKALAKLRSGRAVSTIVAGHVADVDAAMGDAIEAATGATPSRQALTGIRALLQGKLPVTLGEEVETSTLKLAGSLPWKAERLIVTESFETYRQGQASALASFEVPGQRMVAQWTLSPAHEVEDICDDLANGGEVVDGEPGWYAPEDWPVNPHPWCACSQGEIRFLPN